MGVLGEMVARDCMVGLGIVDASSGERLDMRMIRVERRVRVRTAWVCMVLW